MFNRNGTKTLQEMLDWRIREGFRAMANGGPVPLLYDGVQSVYERQKFGLRWHCRVRGMFRK